MYEPIRGGTRGGQGEFKWSDVSADKDREHYLGHSVNAPTGRWQKNKDVHWYNRDVEATEAERREEIRKVKEAEAEALSVALGFAPSKNVASTSQTGEGSPVKVEDKDAEADARKEERRRKKAERKEEKRARKELKRLARREDDERPIRRRADSRSRSRSPQPRPKSIRERDYDNDRPPRGSYEEDERERERERDRRRWDADRRRN